MVVLVTAACSSGNNSNNSPAASTDGEAAKKVTLRFSWWGGDGRHEATLAAIEAYKAIAPNVTIEPEYQGFDGYEQKVKTQLASSNAADIIQLDVPWMEELSKSDFFVDLAAHPDMNLANFNSDFLNNFSVYDGKTVAIPAGVNAYTIIINKTLADELDIPTDVTWDWDMIYETGKALHEKDNSKYLLLADHNMIMNDFTSQLKQKTGKPWIAEDYTLGFTQQDAEEVFAWFEKAIAANVYQPLGEAELYFGKSEQNPKWINQEIPFVPAMSSTLNNMKSVLPEGTEMTTALSVVAKDAVDTAINVRPAQVISVNAKSANVDEAVQFLDWFMNSDEAAVILGDARSIPAVSTAQKAAVDAGKIDPVITRAVEMGLANAGIVDTGLTTNSEITAILQDVVERVAYSKANAAQAAADLVELLTKKLDELKAR